MIRELKMKEGGDTKWQMQQIYKKVHRKDHLIWQ